MYMLKIRPQLIVIAIVTVVALRKERAGCGQSIKNNASSDDGPRRHNSTDDLLDVFMTSDGNVTTGLIINFGC